MAEKNSDRRNQQSGSRSKQQTEREPESGEKAFDPNSRPSANRQSGSRENDFEQTGSSRGSGGTSEWDGTAGDDFGNRVNSPGRASEQQQRRSSPQAGFDADTEDQEDVLEDVDMEEEDELEDEEAAEGDEEQDEDNENR